jgi:GNAT superfamily N-acetyltransferase
MPIRFAKIEDVPELVAGGAIMHQLTRFKSQPYNANKVKQAFEELINKGEGKYVFFIAENSSQKIVGALIGVLEQQIFSDALTASVMHYDVLPEARSGGWAVRLLKVFELWAKNRDVFEVSVGVNSGVDAEKTGAFLAKMGFRNVGGNYAK